jgi:putative membrane protein
VNRQAQAVVLLLVGGAILRASFTDLYLRYVKAGLQPFLIASGILLVAAAVATLWFELRGKAAHDDHGHSHREPAVAWLLVLPVFALLLVAPPALGSYAANRSGTALQETSDFPPLPAGDPVKVGLVDYATRAVYDEGKSLGGRRVQLTGFVMIGHDGAPYLARMTLSCCAADARPVKIGLDGQVPTGLAADTWLEVVGRYTTRSTKDDVNDGVIPYIEIEEFHRIDAPTNQYEG